MKFTTADQVKKSTGFDVKNPFLVTQIGLVFDHYKMDQLPQLWKEAEIAALEKLPTFKSDECFYQKELTKEGEHVWYSFRYYTPKENIIR